MSELLSQERQDVAMNSICHAAQMIQYAFEMVAGEQQRPSAIYRPALSIDGTQWCAVYGENLQDGVAGFGDSPYDAMRDFDTAWSTITKRT